MRPRTIAKHELVGMGATTSQLPTRDWKPLRSPRNQKMQPPSDIASRSPRPRHVAKPDTTATLLMVTGNAMVKLYRLVADLQRLNAERPALQGGSVILPEHLRKMCSLYAQLCEDDFPEMITIEQLEAIIRGSLGMEEEKHTPRMFRLCDPRESGRMNFPRFLVEMMMPVACSGIEKLHYLFSSLSINPRDHEGTLPFVTKREIEQVLTHAGKVQQYYYQWTEEVFASMDGYNVKGLSSRHRLILMHDIDTATGRQPLLHIVIGKCLEPVHEITVALANVQQQTNELTKLANMGITSMMESTSLSTSDMPVFDFNSLLRLWVHFKDRLDYGGPKKQTDKPAPILDHDTFVEVADEFFGDGTVPPPPGRGGFTVAVAIDPQAEQKAMAKVVRKAQLGALFDHVDKLNGLHRLDLREIFVQLSKGIPTMTSAERRDWFFEIYKQPGKRDGTSVMDYIDLAQIVERGMVELHEEVERVQQWCGECEKVVTEGPNKGHRLCSGEAMVASVASTPRIKHAIHLLLTCAL